MHTLTIPVEGMSCGGCLASVQRALTQVPGVSGAVASLSPGEVAVQHDPAVVDTARLVQAIEDAGYTVPAAWLTARPGSAHL